MQKSYSLPQRARNLSVGYRIAIAVACVVGLVFSIVGGVVARATDADGATAQASACTATDYGINGGITVAASGSVLFSLVKDGSVQTVKYGLGKRMRTFDMVADNHRQFFVMKGRPGQKAKLKVLMSDGFRCIYPSIRIPSPLYAHKANVKFKDDCTAVSPMINRSEEHLVYTATLTPSTRPQAWHVPLGPHDFEKLGFDDKVVPTGAIVITSYYREEAGSVSALDIERAPKRC